MYFSLLFLVSFLLLEETDRLFIANGNKTLQKNSAPDEKLLYPELVNRFSGLPPKMKKNYIGSNYSIVSTRQTILDSFQNCIIMPV